MQVWQRASLIKVSEEELAFLAGMNDREKAVAQLWHDKLKLLAVTRGAAGSEICTLAGRALVEPFPVTTVDTTGAGDGFVAGLLYSLQDATEISLERARAAGYFANVVGALTTRRRGAIAALPTFDEVRRAMSAKTLI
jgi:fructokinase